MEVNRIYQGDCLLLMQDIPDKSIDMILCDLPFGQTARNKWDSVIPFNDYIQLGDDIFYEKDLFEFCEYQGMRTNEGYDYFMEKKEKGLWSYYKRIIKDNGAIVLFGNGMFTADLMESNREMWKYNLIWEKTQPTGFLNAKRMPLRAHEDICVFYNKPPIYNPQKTSGHVRKVSKAEHKVNCKETTDYGKHGLASYDSTERYPRSVLTFAKDVQKSALHPTQKPLALCEYLIKTYSNENDLILDNCVGSGTTCLAASNTNRNYIGIEKEEGYCQTAIKRLSTQ